MLTATAYDTHVEQLFDKVRQLHALFSAAGIPYRIVGGMAVFFHVSARDPIRGRLTADVDAGIRREDLPAILAAAEKAGWTYRHVAGVDMLVDARKARSAVHLHPDDSTAQPDLTIEGLPLAPVADLVRMKLTSYRLKDRVHIQDLDGVRLITPDIEASLPDLLRQRLAAVRAEE